MADRRSVPPRVLVGEVVLHALVEDDWPLEQALSHDPDVVRWTYYPDGLDEAGARARIRTAEERFRAGLVRRYAIRDTTGTPLGTCGVARLDDDVPEIFYAVLRDARGRSVATEATRLLAGWVLGHGYRAVALMTVTGNVASERVAAKAGFVAAGEYKDDHRGRRVTIRRWSCTTSCP